MKKLMTLCSLVLFVCATQAVAAAPTQEQLIRMTKAMGITDQLKVHSDMIAEQVKKEVEQSIQQLTTSIPNLSDETKKLVQEEKERFLKKMINAYDTQSIINFYARLMGERLSAEDVDQIIAFLETKAGKNMTKASIEVSGPWTEHLNAEYSQNITPHLQEFYTTLKQIVLKAHQDK